MQSNAAMGAPNVFLACAPPESGLRCALVYLGFGRDACGWFTGPCPDHSQAAAFFLIEDFYSNRPTRDYLVEHAALHSAWALDAARRDELGRMQEAFAHDWLVYRSGGEVSVRPEQLAQFSTLQIPWTYYSPHFERGVLRHLARRWPLEYRDERTEPSS